MNTEPKFKIGENVTVIYDNIKIENCIIRSYYYRSRYNIIYTVESEKSVFPSFFNEKSAVFSFSERFLEKQPQYRCFIFNALDIIVYKDCEIELGSFGGSKYRMNKEEVDTIFSTREKLLNGVI